MYDFMAAEGLIPFVVGIALAGAFGLIIGDRHHEGRMGAIKGATAGLCGSIVGAIAWYGYVGFLLQREKNELGFAQPVQPPAWYVPWLFLLGGVLLFSSIHFIDLQMRLRVTNRRQGKDQAHE